MTLATLFATLVHILQPGFVASPRLAPRAQGFADTEVLPGETACGCGWFDSSHDLKHGLVVHEGIIVTDAAYPVCPPAPR